MKKGVLALLSGQPTLTAPCKWLVKRAGRGGHVSVRIGVSSWLGGCQPVSDPTGFEAAAKQVVVLF